MNLNVISKTFNLSKNDIVNVFILGSRLWGSVTANNDYDITVIIKGNNHKKCLHAHNLNAKVMTYDEYENSIEEHKFLDLVTLFLPSQNILIQKRRAPATVNNKILSEVIISDSKQDWNRVLKLLQRGELAHAKKILTHTIRMCILGLQLINTGTITDFKCAEDIRMNLADVEYIDDTWPQKYYSACGMS